MPYVFVAAALVAVLATAILFKITIEKIKEKPGSVGNIQVRFFIGVGISEFVPIILLVYGFANMEKVANIEDLYLPAFIIFLAIAIAIFFIFLQRAVGTNHEQTQKIANRFAMMSFVLVSSLPIVSLIGLFVMAP